MDVEFKDLEELYRRIKPALHTKSEEMRRAGYPYIKEEDIWNYLKEEKWSNSKNLDLYQMVSDILNIDSSLVDRYLKNKISMRNRNIYFEEDEEDGKEI